MIEQQELTRALGRNLVARDAFPYTTPVGTVYDTGDYQRALDMIHASRGKDARRLVDDTFRRFFLGVTTDLDWLDTASQITGGVAH